VLARRGATFDAGASRDPDGDRLSFSWTFGDGTDPVTTDENSTIHVFLSPGAYTVLLTVSDGNATNTSLRTVQVGNAPAGAGPQTSIWPVMAVGLVILIAVVGGVYFAAVRKEPEKVEKYRRSSGAGRKKNE